MGKSEVFYRLRPARLAPMAGLAAVEAPGIGEHPVMTSLWLIRAPDLSQKLGVGAHGQGWRHAAFVDRLGDTFPWKGENVATTDVEAAVSADPAVEAVTVFGVQVPGTDGRAGMAAVVCSHGTELDGKALATTVYKRLPSHAVPLFVRVVDSLEHTSTVKSKKSGLRDQGYGPGIDDSLYVLKSREEGYVPYYDEYPGEVAAGSRPKG